MSHDGEMQETLGPAGLKPPRLSPREFLDRLDAATGQFADLVETGDLEAPVPSCPDWTFADLVGHLGGVHQWATHAVVAGTPDGQPIPAPSARPSLVDWYRDSAETLSGTLKRTDPHAPAWTFGPKPRTAAFWYRRQVHETTIHLWDAATAHTRPAGVECLLALDGIDELTGMFFPRQVRLGRVRPLGRALALETSGHGGHNRWVLAGDGLGPASAPDAPAEATITGPVEALLLLLWGRIRLDDPRLVLTGDETAAHVVLTTAITP